MYNLIEVTAYRPAGEGLALVDVVFKPLRLHLHGCVLQRDQASGEYWLHTVGTFPDEADHRRFAGEVLRQAACKWRLP